MPYVPANVPEEYNAAFVANELQRVGEAYNLQEAIGLLAFDPALNPHPSQIVTATPAILENWDFRGPAIAVSDGPVNMDPRIHPDNEIETFEPGVYLITFFIAFSHVIGAEVVFEVYRNGLRTYLLTAVDASQQTSESTATATGVLVLDEGGILDMRVSTPTPNEAIQAIAGAFTAFKLRDLRTRFS